MDNVTSLTDTQRRLYLYTNISLELLRDDPNILTWSRILFWIFATWGLIANITVACVILKHRKVLLEIPSNLLLLNLAIADLLGLLTVVTLRIVGFATHADEEAASVASNQDSIVVQCQSLVSNWTVTVVAIFQCTAVLWPIKFHVFITKKRTLLILGMIWLVVVALSIPMLLMYQPGAVFSLEFYVSGTVDNMVVFWNVFECISKSPPLLTIFCLYPVIFRKLHKSMQDSNRTDGTRANIHRTLKHIVYVYITLLLYLSFSMMVNILFFYFSFLTDPDVPYDDSKLRSLTFLNVVSIPFQISYTILNPIIHALVTENFKKYYVPKRWRKVFNVTSTENNSARTEPRNPHPTENPQSSNPTPQVYSETAQ